MFRSICGALPGFTAGGTPAVAEMPPNRSAPAVLRSTPLKPLLFSWESRTAFWEGALVYLGLLEHAAFGTARMWAEWPRGKVQKLTVPDQVVEKGFVNILSRVVTSCACESGGRGWVRLGWLPIPISTRASPTVCLGRWNDPKRAEHTKDAWQSI